MLFVRRVATLLVLLACALPAGEAAAAVRTFPGCGSTLAACMNSSPAGTTIRLRTNTLIPIPDTMNVTKGLSLVAAPGYRPRIGRTGTIARLGFLPAESPARLTFRGIFFRQVSVSVEFGSGTGHQVVFENNRVLVNTLGDYGVSIWFSGTSEGSLSVRNNDISSSGLAVQLRAQGGPATVTGNRVTAPVNANSSAGIELNAGLGTVRALVANNLVHDVAGCGCGTPAGMILAAYLGGALDLRLLNNTVVDVDPAANPYGVYVVAFDPPGVDAVLFNNTVSHSDHGISLVEQGGSLEASGDLNNTYDVPGGDALGSHPMGTMLHVAPGFRNVGANDFGLRRTSPLKNAGQTCIEGLPIPRADAAGKFRLAGRAVDVGAYEQGSTLSGGVRGRSASGTDAAKTMNGTSGVDVLCGLGGADRLYGRGGSDFLFGGDGNDRAFGGDGADFIDVRDGTNGNDRAFGGPGRDSCLRDPGDLRRDCP